MKILHVIASLAPRDGGPPVACRDMARAAARAGHAVTIYTTDWDGPGRLDVTPETPREEDGVRVVYFPVGFPRILKTSPRLARRLWRDFHEFDVVHVHGLYLFHDWVVARCLAATTPARRATVLVHTHGGLLPSVRRRHGWLKGLMNRLFQNRLLRGSRGVVFTSSREERLSLPHLPPTRHWILPLGIDVARFRDLPAGSFRQHRPKLAGRHLILFLGRLHFVKGLDLLCQAMARVREVHEDAHLVLAGGDDTGFGATLRRLIDENGLASRVTLTGPLDRDEADAALADAALLVLPSYGENFGLAVVEAMAAGRPVVVSDQVGIADEVGAAGAGLVVALETAPLAEAICTILADPVGAAAMGERGRALAAKRFSLEALTAGLEDFYRALSTEEAGR